MNVFRIAEARERGAIRYHRGQNTFWPQHHDIGKYFSALSNEANLRGRQEAWLIFGISDDKKIVGTDFRKQGGLQNLKREIVTGTNERLAFMEIYILNLEKCRIIAFQIPPAIRGIPTTWQGAAYAREHESISPLPMNKAGITIKGKITRTALLLLGKKESSYFFDGFIPRITWTLYNADNSVKTYEHFDMPLLLAVDKVFSRIRNVKYRYIAGQQTLFPDEVDQYEPELIKEIFINEGGFIPETIEQALEPGYKPPYYRNVFLCNAMVNLYMIDTNSMGIPMMYQIQRDKCFPLPTYDCFLLGTL